MPCERATKPLDVVAFIFRNEPQGRLPKRIRNVSGMFPIVVIGIRNDNRPE